VVVKVGIADISGGGSNATYGSRTPKSGVNRPSGLHGTAAPATKPYSSTHQSIHLNKIIQYRTLKRSELAPSDFYYFNVFLADTKYKTMNMLSESISKAVANDRQTCLSWALGNPCNACYGVFNCQ